MCICQFLVQILLKIHGNLEKWKWTIENNDEVKFCDGKEKRSAWFEPYNGGKEERSSPNEGPMK